MIVIAKESAAQCAAALCNEDPDYQRSFSKY
jgi:hypothetical protein